MPGSYIVTFADHTLTGKDAVARARTLARAYKGTVGDVWDKALHGFSVFMSERQAERLAVDPRVASVEQEHRERVTDDQTNVPSWGLDRIDQRVPPLDHIYRYAASAGAGVHIYIVDTGIRRSHQDFSGRVTYGPDYVDNDLVSEDTCNGHGTHVAGIAAGTTYGVAKKAQIVAVRSFDCQGHSVDHQLLNGINWVIGHAVKPAVLNLSVNHSCTDGAGDVVPCPAGESQDVVAAEQAAVAAGISVVVGAGNEDQDACNDTLSTATGVVTVGATNADDSKRSSSNYGPCVDIWAPGTNIMSDWIASDTDTRTDSGTSMAAPMVAGTLALMLATPQFASATPAQLKTQLTSTATAGVVTGLDALGVTSPNKMLYTTPPPAPGGSSVALARNADGRLELFGADPNGFMVIRAQDSANSTTWGPWTRSTTKSWFSVAADTNANNHIELAALTAASSIATWHRHQTADNTNAWTGLSQISGELSAIALARNADGRMQMFGVNQEGQTWYGAQISAGSRAWQPLKPFTPFAAQQMRSIAAETRGDGGIEVVATDWAGNVWESRQATDGTDTWSDGTQIVPVGDPKLLSEVALARHRDGSLDLIGTDGAGHVYYSTLFAGNWLSWNPLMPKTLLHIAAETNADGRIQLVGVDTTGAIWQSTEDSPTAITYTPWSSVDGQLRP